MDIDKIDPKIRRSWKILYEYGDIEKIINSTKSITCLNGIARRTISNAFNHAKMNEKTFEAIQKYYREKALDKKNFAKENIIEID